MAQKGGNSWYSYRRCPNDAIPKCLQELVRICRDSPIRVAKVLRLSMGLVGALFKRLPSLKVILLIRDPRAIMSSRCEFTGAFKKHADTASLSLCIKLYEDIKQAKQLQIQYPSRVKIVKYESIADKPLLEMKKLYHFIGYKYTNVDMEIIYNVTHGLRKTVTYRGFVRNNSLETAMKWTKDISPYLYQCLQKHCINVYHLLEYRIYRNFKDLARV